MAGIKHATPWLPQFITDQSNGPVSARYRACKRKKELHRIARTARKKNCVSHAIRVRAICRRVCVTLRAARLCDRSDHPFIPFSPSGHFSKKKKKESNVDFGSVVLEIFIDNRQRMTKTDEI